MELPANLDTMEPKAMRAWAQSNLGVNLHASMGADKMRERIREEYAAQDPAQVGPPPDQSPPVEDNRPRTARVQEVIPLRDMPIEETAVIEIGDSNTPMNQDPVPVFVNGRSFYIKRNHPVRVPRYVLEVLDHAVEESWRHEDPNDMTSPRIVKKVRSYPYSIVAGPADNDTPELLARLEANSRRTKPAAA